MAQPTPFPPGFRTIDGSDLNKAFAEPQWATYTGITAQADGLRPGSPTLNPGINTVSTVAGAADSVQLPAANAGDVVVLRNAGANACQVFAYGSDTINGTAGSTGISVAANKTVMFFAANNVSGVTTWFSLLTA
jgi:hypothetical protein